MTLRPLLDASVAAHKADQDAGTAKTETEARVADELAKVNADKTRTEAQASDADRLFAAAIQAHDGQVIDGKTNPPTLYLSEDGLTFTSTPIYDVDSDDAPKTDGTGGTSKPV